MITEFIKEHKKLCILILLIIIIIVLILVNINKNDGETTETQEPAGGEEVSEPADISSQLEDDLTTQTVYNGYIYGVE